MTLGFCTGSVLALTADFRSCDNFWTTFIFARINDPYLWITLLDFWLIFVTILTLNFQGQIWNLLYLCQKMTNCHETKSKHSDWTLGPKLTLAMTLTLNFQGQIRNLLWTQTKMVRLPWNKKHTYCLYSRPWMWPWHLSLAMTLTLTFQGQIWNLPYLNQK